MVRALLVSVCLSALATVGCTVTTSNPARDDCDSLVQDNFCPRVVDSCGYVSFSGCVAAAESQLGCGSVIDDSPSGLSVCDADINNYSCGTLFYSSGDPYVPSSCIDSFYH